MILSFLTQAATGLRRAMGLAALLAALAALPGGALAIELNDARSQGLVGERADGLVGAVSPTPTSDVMALVESINSQRMANYRAIAQKNGTPVEAVQAIAGETQVKRAIENGWFVMDTSGVWRKN